MQYNFNDSNLVTGIEISNICTLYINTLKDKIYSNDTESDCHISINVNWEKYKLNKISCTSLSVPISNYIIPQTTNFNFTINDITTNKTVTVNMVVTPGMITSAATLVKSINAAINSASNNFGGDASYFVYDYDSAIFETGSAAYNQQISPYVTTGRIYSPNNYNITINSGNDVMAPILGLSPAVDPITKLPIIQYPVIINNNYAFPYVADIIPYSIIYLACDECNNGLQSSNGSSILASIFYNNEANFTYMKQDYSMVDNCKWITRKTNTLHFYFLDENKNRIKNFNGIGAFFTINLFNDASDQPV